MTKSAKPPAELKKKVFSKAQRQLPNFRTGLRAEAIARDFLIKKNYVLLNSNLSLVNREVDIIAHDSQQDEIVFIEVKYRRNDHYGEGSSAVSGLKLRNMQKVANAYLRKMQLQKAHRFDIISICGDLSQPQIEHFENITWL